MRMSESEQMARILQVRADVRKGRAESALVPSVDDYDRREYVADALKGAHEKTPEIWRQVMEAFKFAWLEPSELNQSVGPMKVQPARLEGLVDAEGRPVPGGRLYWFREHKVGQWRNERLHMAFTIEDLFGLFRDPETFDRWIREEIVKRRAKAAGLIV